MSEITLYEAQAKKMQGICDEHNLTYRFLKDRYPIIFIIRPIQGMDAQISMLEAVEEAGYISPEAEMMSILVRSVFEIVNVPPVTRVSSAPSLKIHIISASGLI